MPFIWPGDSWPRHGVVYAGADRQPMRATLAVTGRPAMLGESRPDMAYWDKLVRDVREAGDQRVVISSEFFADGDDATARRVVADLGGPRVHVVVTLRPLARVMPSQWQQYLQNGLLHAVPGVARRDAQAAAVRSADPHLLVAPWSKQAGARGGRAGANVSVIVVTVGTAGAVAHVRVAAGNRRASFWSRGRRGQSVPRPSPDGVRQQLDQEVRSAGSGGSQSRQSMRHGAVRQMKGRGCFRASRRSPPRRGHSNGWPRSAPK